MFTAYDMRRLPISKDTFASWAKKEEDADSKAYYEAMAQTEDSDTAARRVIIQKYKQQPHGLHLEDNGYCDGFTRRTTSPRPESPVKAGGRRSILKKKSNNDVG